MTVTMGTPAFARAVNAYHDDTWCMVDCDGSTSQLGKNVVQHTPQTKQFYAADAAP